MVHMKCLRKAEARTIVASRNLALWGDVVAVPQPNESGRLWPSTKYCGTGKLFRSREIVFELRGSEGEDILVVVESIARVVLIEGIGGGEIHSEKVTNRVVVLGAVESVRGKAWRRARLPPSTEEHEAHQQEAESG
jgi:hypothetical protein